MSLFNGIEVLFYPFWASASVCFSINLPFRLFAEMESRVVIFQVCLGAGCPGSALLGAQAMVLYLILAGVRISLVTGAPVCCSR